MIERLLIANGVKTDLETALFDVDHAIRLPHALALARVARADRPSIDGDDVLAWALARNGRCAEALGYSKQALRLGTKDALKSFHRGMIERCLGHDAAARTWFARALDLNPHFSLLWAPTARRGAGMKRLVLVIGLAAALLAPVAATAHPLGNFTINQFSRIEVSGPRVYVVYVLDMAEIPTFQAGRIDADAYARRIAANAHLTVDGQDAALVPVAHALAHPRGAGGLRTTRLELVLRGPALHGKSTFAYRDGNYAGRIGWKEVVVGANGGEPKRRASRVSEGPAREPAPGDDGLRPGRARRRRGRAAGALAGRVARRRPIASRTAASRRSSAVRSSRRS